ncbi:MAG: hypothetical protein KDK41_17835 [Leptospiraceae bacterium]|nr:hypothetical protein [Leptospiraceae bacterium]MCB1202507.1 hypothetical protein [Leptospiraceae bacterium]
MKESVLRTRAFESFVWYDLCNPGEEELRNFSSEHNLDFQLVQDVLQVGHLPKFEKLPGYDFLILRAFVNPGKKQFNTLMNLTNKVSFFVKKDKLITVHRAEFAFFFNKDRKYQSCDELLLELMNDMIQTFHEPAEEHVNQVTEIEKVIFLNNQGKLFLEDLYHLRSESRIFKKLLGITERTVSSIALPEANNVSLQDLKDSLLELNLQFSEVNDDLQELLQTYLSLEAGKNNDVMKMLTVFSAFFLPLTFIAGVYGMNFDYMPELRAKLGYFYTMGAMGVISIGIFVWFRVKKIIGS